MFDVYGGLARPLRQSWLSHSDTRRLTCLPLQYSRKGRMIPVKESSVAAVRNASLHTTSEGYGSFETKPTIRPASFEATKP